MITPGELWRLVETIDIHEFAVAEVREHFYLGAPRSYVVTGHDAHYDTEGQAKAVAEAQLADRTFGKMVPGQGKAGRELIGPHAEHWKEALGFSTIYPASLNVRIAGRHPRWEPWSVRVDLFDSSTRRVAHFGDSVHPVRSFRTRGVGGRVAADGCG